MSEFKMYMVGYDTDFKKSCKSGWGCGYVMIPMSSKVATLIEAEKLADEEQCEKEDYVSYYIPTHMAEECTFFEEKNVNGVDYYVVGFDTAHSWNGPRHNFEYVFTQTQAALALYEEMEAKLPEPYLDDVV